MKTKQLEIAIEYLESVSDIELFENICAVDPRIDAQKMGECLYCGAALDEGKPHKKDCYYLEAKRLLTEFKNNSLEARRLLAEFKNELANRQNK